MRIGILTFHRSINNGAVMQCYSLSKRIQRDFPQAQVEVIDYNMPVVEEQYRVSLKKFLSAKTIVGKCKRCARLLLDPFWLRRMKTRQQTFVRVLRNLPLSDSTILSSDRYAIANYINERYDVLVVGSDAVWNYTLRKFPSIYLPGSEVTVKKLSYAASCYGMDFLTHEDDRAAVGEVLRDFSFLGVRDQATEDFVKWGDPSLTPTHTCDPTAFLDVDDLPIDEQQLRRTLAKKGFDFSKPTIGVMGTPAMVKMVRSFFGKRYQIAALYEPTRGADVQLYDLTPYEWAYVFRFFKLTFTTYFHGTMLSLRNGVPLICIALKTEFAKRHTPKTLDVLTRIGYADWYFETDYQGQNYAQISKKAEELLQQDLKQSIIQRLDREAESYAPFRDALSRVLDVD